MSKSIRIRTTPNGSDKYVKVKLDNEFDFLEILSLKITQEDVYKRFSSDYGVIAGRVTCNSGLGVPNVKISVFIPLSEDDETDFIINTFYPYKSVTDKSGNGLRYNLLPNNSQGECHSPVGSMPSKAQILDEPKMIEIYEKYYRYSTVTNSAGDYMIFGVPTGNHIVHMDADISDIGYLSQKPYDMIRKGSNVKLFDSYTKFKEGTNLDTLIQIKSSNTGVDVMPFWGDKEISEVGISRVDFDLGYYIEPTAIFIGSIISDDEKHSVNKQCRPRKKTGDLCEMISGEGTVEMIRKTIDGNIEQFDVEGGRVIDGDGTWAYQIPMNLDYKVTDEFGNLVESGDPSKGIPTSAKVRFRVSMDTTGGEGRLRTRASYLVPNNPKTDTLPDYSFGENTPESYMYEMKFNKLYTVKNFISRYQPNRLANNRNFIGIKNVDDCGSRTPFPYNRVDTDFNPLFSIICLIVSLITTLVATINLVIILPVNEAIKLINEAFGIIDSIINGIVNGVCWITDKLKFRCPISVPDDIIPKIPYIPCISMTCNDTKYSPWCMGKGLDKLRENNDGTLIDTDYDAFTDCISEELGDALNVFEFDFYNDWINGVLYLPLIKYKKKRRSKAEKFCEYDCKDFDDNERKNDCNSAFIIDTCTASHSLKDADASQLTYMVREGIVKKFEDNFYYAPITHQDNRPMFMTDITLLGSIIKNDYDNMPIIYDSLFPTTYQIPEYGSPDSNDDETRIQPLFFNKVNCFDFNVTLDNCRNINLACELGVELGTNDLIGCSADPDDVDGNIDDTINDINDSLTRRYIIGMNSGNYTPDQYYSIDDRFASGDGNYYRGDSPIYNDYFSYRGINNQYSTNLRLPRGGSLYFYFGLIPGMSALEKAKGKFFLKCAKPETPELIADAEITNASSQTSNDGTIKLIIHGGTPPFIIDVYKVGDVTPIHSGYETSEREIIFPGLGVGDYIFNITESSSEKLYISKTVTMKSVASLKFNATVTNCSTNTSADGMIMIDYVLGGKSPYMTNKDGGTYYPISNGSYLYSGLTVSTYTISVKDSSVPPFVVSENIEVKGPEPLSVTINKTDCSCYDSSDGIISLSISGDKKPYTINVSDGGSYTSTGYTSVDLHYGIYTVSVNGSSGGIFNGSSTITRPTQVTMTYTADTISCYGGTGGISFTGYGGAGGYKYSIDGGYSWSDNDTFNDLPSKLYNLMVKDSNECKSAVISYELEEPEELINTSTLGANVINLSAIGGTPTYTYHITLPGGTITSTTDNTFSLTGQPNGTYSVKVIDANLCESNIIQIIY